MLRTKKRLDQNNRIEWSRKETKRRRRGRRSITMKKREWGEREREREREKERVGKKQKRINNNNKKKSKIGYWKDNKDCVFEREGNTKKRRRRRKVSSGSSKRRRSPRENSGGHQTSERDTKEHGDVALPFTTGRIVPPLDLLLYLFINLYFLRLLSRTRRRKLSRLLYTFI